MSMSYTFHVKIEPPNVSVQHKHQSSTRKNYLWQALYRVQFNKLVQFTHQPQQWQKFDASYRYSTRKGAVAWGTWTSPQTLVCLEALGNLVQIGNFLTGHRSILFKGKIRAIDLKFCVAAKTFWEVVRNTLNTLLDFPQGCVEKHFCLACLKQLLL